MARFVLFGDGRWAAASLEHLVSVGHTCTAVVVRTAPSGPELLAQVRALGVPAMIPERVNAPQFVRDIAALRPDVCVSIAYDQIFRSELLALAPLGMLNFHAGKLPRYRGRNCINWAILNGETEIGLTAHYVDEGIDTGDIILQRSLPLSWTDTYGDALCRIVQAFPAFVAEGMELVLAGQVRRVAQPQGPGTYFSGRDERDEWLDWSDTSRNLHNKIRAITRPAPGARTVLGEHEVRIWRAYYDPAWPCFLGAAGQVVGREPDGVVVKTGDSVLLVKEAQLQGNPPEAPCWRIGERLGVNLACVVRQLQSRVATLEKAAAERRTNGDGA
jgi:methionyl-tRNA formyltransferase